MRRHVPLILVIVGILATGATIIVTGPRTYIDTNTFSGSLVSSGTATFSGSTTFTGAATHTAAATFQNAATFTSTVSVTGTETHTGVETHTGAATFQGAVTATSTVSLRGDASIGSLVSQAWTSAQSVTIATGEITPTVPYTVVISESGDTDTLTTVNGFTGTLWLAANGPTATIVVSHATTANAIMTTDGQDMTLTAYGVAVLYRETTSEAWRVVGGTGTGVSTGGASSAQQVSLPLTFTSFTVTTPDVLAGFEALDESFGAMQTTLNSLASPVTGGTWLCDETVSSSAASYTTTTAYAMTPGTAYKLYIYGESSDVAGDLRLWINGDTTTSNYGSGWAKINYGTTVWTSGGGSSTIADVGQFAWMIEMTIAINVDGYAMGYGIYRDTSLRENFIWNYNASTVSSITSITLATTSGNIVAGTKIRIVEILPPGISVPYSPADGAMIFADSTSPTGWTSTVAPSEGDLQQWTGGAWTPKSLAELGISAGGSSYAVVAWSGDTIDTTFTTGSWHTITIATEEFDPDNIVTLTDNRIALAAGTYRIDAHLYAASSIGTYGFYLRYYNITAGDYVGTIRRARNSADGGDNDWAHPSMFTLASAADLRWDIYPTGNNVRVYGTDSTPSAVAVIIIEKLP